jgi:hypothetical protein
MCRPFSFYLMNFPSILFAAHDVWCSDFWSRLCVSLDVIAVRLDLADDPADLTLNREISPLGTAAK